MDAVIVSTAIVTVTSIATTAKIVGIPMLVIIEVEACIVEEGEACTMGPLGCNNVAIAGDTVTDKSLVVLHHRNNSDRSTEGSTHLPFCGHLQISLL